MSSRGRGRGRGLRRVIKEEPNEPSSPTPINLPIKRLGRRRGRGRGRGRRGLRKVLQVAETSPASASSIQQTIETSSSNVIDAPVEPSQNDQPGARKLEIQSEISLSIQHEIVEKYDSEPTSQEEEEIIIEVEMPINNQQFNYSSLYDPINALPNLSGEHSSEITDIAEVKDPKTGGYVFGKIVRKDTNGAIVELMLFGMTKRPQWFFPEYNMHPPGTFLDIKDIPSLPVSESASTNRAFSESSAPAMYHQPQPQQQPFFHRIPWKGVYLGFYERWYEYMCGRCGDVFPLERSFSKKMKRVLCSSCRFPNLYMDIPSGLQCYQRPPCGWPTELCTICHRAYPTRLARRGLDAKCITCRCEFNERVFSDAHCPSCGVVHFGACLMGVGGPEYLQRLLEMKAGEEIQFF